MKDLRKVPNDIYPCNSNHDVYSEIKEANLMLDDYFGDKDVEVWI